MTQTFKKINVHFLNCYSCESCAPTSSGSDQNPKSRKRNSIFAKTRQHLTFYYEAILVQKSWNKCVAKCPVRVVKHTLIGKPNHPGCHELPPTSLLSKTKETELSDTLTWQSHVREAICRQHYLEQRFCIVRSMGHANLFWMAEGKAYICHSLTQSCVIRYILLAWNPVLASSKIPAKKSLGRTQSHLKIIVNKKRMISKKITKEKKQNKTGKTNGR